MKPRVVSMVLLPAALLLMPLAVYLLDQSVTEGEVPRNVSVGEVDLSGLAAEDALLAMQAYEQELRTTPAAFSVNETRFEVLPESLDLDIDEEAAVDAAMAQRREGNVLSRFWGWVTGFSSPIQLELPATLDDDAVDDQLVAWGRAAIPNPAFDGSVDVVEGEVVIEYPRAGEKIDEAVSTGLIYDSVTRRDRALVDLPVVASTPVITNSQVDAAASQVRRAIDADVTLSNEQIDFTVTFLAADIARAIGTRVHNESAEIEVLIDEDVITGILDPLRGSFELPPVDARYDIDIGTDAVTIVPSRYGTALDAPAVAASLLEAALGDGTGPFPVAEADPPAFTTEQAEAYGPLTLVAKFSTNTPGTNRVHNIHLMADTVDGWVTLPGEVFSLNGAAGQRTLEKGYLEDCAIVAGDILCEGHPANIGGGVSQFATTLYNAGFFGCYEDVEHRPHSLYFERYPEAREATLGYPSPDVKIGNDSPAPFVIKTAYTSSVITVRIYGNTGGRTCDAELSERGNLKEYETVYVADVDDEYGLAPGQERRETTGHNGWTVTSTRVITHADGRVEREPFWWRYSVLDERIFVHPCMVTGEPVGCPIQIPALTGLTYANAAGQLAELGFVVIRVEVSVDDPAEDEIVISVAPAKGTWVDIGESVTLTVGVYEGPGDGDGDGDGG